MDDARNERLQDYLDGRLSPAERERFERLLSEDAELRSRAEAYRRIGRTLREGAADLPPGFHARARARFEQASVGSRWRLRAFSWEGAGIAAAAVLALALFAPWLANRRESAPPQRRAADAESKVLNEGPAKQVAPEPAPAADQEAETVPRLADKDSGGGGKLRASERAEPERSAAADAGAPPAELMEFAPQPRVTGTDEKPQQKRDRAAAPATSSPVGGRIEPERSSADMREGDDEAREDRANAYRVDRLQSAGFAEIAVAPAAAPLPEGFEIEADELRLLDGDAARGQVSVGASAPRTVARDAPADDRRTVLVGGPGVDCDAIRVVELESRYEIHVPAARTAGRHPGCALSLPRDGKPVVRVDSARPEAP